MFDPIHPFRHLLRSSHCRRRPPRCGTKEKVRNLKSSVKRIFPQIEEKSLHNMDPGKTNQILWIFAIYNKVLGIKENFVYDTEFWSKNHILPKNCQNQWVSINLFLLHHICCWQMSNCIHLEWLVREAHVSWERCSVNWKTTGQANLSILTKMQVCWL